jgi:FkbM family methyltransferase
MNMRFRLLGDPLLVLEKIGSRAARLRRRRRLAGTAASRLMDGHTGSLSLLDIVIAAQRPAVVYDVGAHVGTWTLLVKSVIPEANIHAFEPLPRHIDAFLKRTSSCSDIHLHRTGLGSDRSTSQLHVANLSDASSFLQIAAAGRETYGLTAVEEVEVPITSIDTAVAAGEVPPPDLLKLDVQGFELEVLRGARNALRTCRWVISEVSFERYYQEQPLFHEIAGHMFELGFVVHALSHQTPLGSRLTQTDVLFENIDLRLR